MDWMFVPPADTYVETLSPNVAEDGASKEVSKVDWGDKGGAQISYN